VARLALSAVAAVTFGTAVAVLAVPSQPTAEVAAGPAPWPDPVWRHPALATTTTTTVPPSPRVLPTSHPGRARSAATVPAHPSPRRPLPATVAAPSSWSGPWACIARYESGGNPSENTGNGYYGGLQFSLSTWRAYGGHGRPDQASIATQEQVATRVLAGQGWRAWPNTSLRCGL
jgi:hypothetical protein